MSTRISRAHAQLEDPEVEAATDIALPVAFLSSGLSSGFSQGLSSGEMQEFEPASRFSSKLEEEFLKPIIENYVRYYAAGEGHTARAKRYDLQYFLEFIAGSRERSEFVRMSDWTMQRTKDFVDSRLECGEAPATVSRRLATVKHFGRTLAERIPGFVNPAREVKGPVLQPGRPERLEEKDITLLRRALLEPGKEEREFIIRRNQCLLELLLATGLRADEVRLLSLGQLSDDSAWLRNVKTKGRKFRDVYIEHELRPLLASYLTLREEELSAKVPHYHGLSLNERLRFPMFISLYRVKLSDPRSFGMSPKSIWRVISEAGKRAELLAGEEIPHLHPHMLRHTFAHGLLDSSRDVRLVAQALGHSDVRITMRYTERTNDEIAKAIEEKRSLSK